MIRDVPVRTPDTRTDEEKRYPEFFRAKLKGSMHPPLWHCMPAGQPLKRLYEYLRS